MTNVLLTGVGRRNYLVGFFRDALRGAGRVLAADAAPHAAAMQAADRGFVVPLADDPDYVDRLLEICREHDVRLVVPLNDLELPVLAAARQRFLDQGTYPAVSSPEIVALCLDKFATSEFLVRHGFAAPRTWRTIEDALRAVADRETPFPLIVKPRWGSGSFCVETVYSEEELRAVLAAATFKLGRNALGANGKNGLLIQERLPGQEYGLDIVNDFQGRYVATFVKKKLSMRAGETDRAVTVDDRSLQDLGRRIGERMRHVGNLDCDLFVGERGPIVLEFNPRFGGGYPFSHRAGANLPAAYLHWAGHCGFVAEDCFAVRPNVVSAKYDLLIDVGTARIAESATEQSESLRPLVSRIPVASRSA